MENLNETQVPRFDITICIDPPSDNKDLGPTLADPIHWTDEHYQGQQSSFHGYSPASAPQAIPRLNTSYEDLNNPGGVWEARSPCSSDSGWSNPSSPRIDQFSEEFRDDGSDYLSDNRSYVSDQEVFDIDAFLNLSTTDTQSPDNSSFPPDFLSGPEPYTTSPTLRDTNPGPFPMQSLSYTSPYTIDRASSSSSLEYAHGYPRLSTSYKDVLPVKPTHQRSTSDFLAPPPTLARGARSHSRGRGHRFTISEGSDPFLSPHAISESSMFLGDDLRGRGLARAKTAPSTKSISRGKSPYERPPSQSAVGTRLVIPMYAGPISGQSSPDLECPSPGSIKDVVATDAMIQASARRRTREANYFCSHCGNSFTTENSRKRHESSHSGEKPYSCSFDGCGQMFSNDDDRKRHENKSKKHARS